MERFNRRLSLKLELDQSKVRSNWSAYLDCCLEYNLDEYSDRKRWNIHGYIDSTEDVFPLPKVLHSHTDLMPVKWRKLLWFSHRDVRLTFWNDAGNFRCWPHSGGTWSKNILGVPTAPVPLFLFLSPFVSLRRKEVANSRRTTWHLLCLYEIPIGAGSKWSLVTDPKSWLLQFETTYCHLPVHH